MAKVKKIEERMKVIEEIAYIKKLENSSKYLIFIDKYYSELNINLKTLGYESELIPEFIELPKVDRAYQKHLWINSKSKNIKDKAIVFITKDSYRTFSYFDRRNYSILNIRRNYHIDKLVNKIILLLKTYSFNPHRDYCI